MIQWGINAQSRKVEEHMTLPINDMSVEPQWGRLLNNVMHLPCFTMHYHAFLMGKRKKQRITKISMTSFQGSCLHQKWMVHASNKTSSTNEQKDDKAVMGGWSDKTMSNITDEWVFAVDPQLKTVFHLDIHKKMDLSSWLQSSCWCFGRMLN